MKLYHQDFGGPHRPLLLLAGFATDAVSWLYQVETLRAEFRVLVCDNRGVGRSPKPRGPYSLQQMAQDVLELLDDLGIGRLHVLGHSMGGAIAQRLALDAPERIDRLVLACTASRFGGRSLTVVESWAGCVGMGAPVELLARVLYPWLYTAAFLNQPGNLEAAVAGMRQHPYPLDPEGLEGQVEALRGHDTRTEIHRIGAPTLVLGAEEDLLVSPGECRGLAEAIPGAALAMLANTGHACMLESPESFNQAVLSFLREGGT